MILTRPLNASMQEMTDKFSIKELIEFERFCRDNAIWNEMKTCFSPDATVDISWFCGSAYEFVEASSKQNMFAPHKLYSTVISIKDDKAFALSMATLEIRTLMNGVLVNLLTDAKLVYRLKKTDGIWYIVRFESIYEKDSIIPVYADGSLIIDPNDLVNFRQSYAGMSYMQSLQGNKLNNNLPGIDRPDLVEKLYAESEEWLNNLDK